MKSLVLLFLSVIVFKFPAAYAVTGFTAPMRPNYIRMQDIEFKFYSQASLSATGTLAIPGDVVSKPYTQSGLKEAVLVTKQTLEERFLDFQNTLNDSLAENSPMASANMNNLLESVLGYVAAVTSDMKDYLPKSRISMTFVVMPGKKLESQSLQPLLTDKSSLKDINWALRSLRQALINVPVDQLPPVSPMGTLIRIDLEQGASQVVIQTVAALNPLERSFVQATDSAEFSSVVVPQASTELGAPVVLSTVTIPLFKKDVWPSFELNFGYGAKLETGTSSDDFMITVQNDGFMCSEVSSFPYLSGYEMYTGYIPIRAYIKSAELDIKELEIKILEVRAGVAPAGCFNQDIAHKSLIPAYGGDNPKFSEFWNEMTTWIGLSLEELHAVVEKERATSSLFNTVK